MRIDDEFKRVCEEHGGEIEDKGYEIVCKIWDDEEKFIEFSKWMQKNILPKKHELRKIYASDYSFIDTLPNVFARFEISRTSGKLITGAKTYPRINCNDNSLYVPFVLSAITWLR